MPKALVRESGDAEIVKLAKDLLKLDDEEKELARQINKSSDIYLLGAILYEIAVGHPPHYVRIEYCMKEAEKTKKPARYVKQMHELRLALNNQIQQWVRPKDPLRISLRDIAMKAMATDPNDRFQSVKELQDAIRDFQQQVQGLELAETGKELLAKASGREDYQHLLPALESFRGAMDLYPDEDANELQVETACTYGNRAYARKDFDAGLDILDEYVSEESVGDKKVVAVRDKLEKGKRVRQRNRTLAWIASVSAIVLPLSVLAVSSYLIAGVSKKLTFAQNELGQTQSEIEDIQASAEIVKAEAKRQTEEAQRTIQETEIRIEKETREARKTRKS